MYHKHDFNFKAEHHFFATSHGKSPYDRIGGTIKKEAANASLSCISSDKISVHKFNDPKLLRNPTTHQLGK